MSLFKTAAAVAENLAAPAPFVPAGLGDDSVVLASQALTTAAPVEILGMTRPFYDYQGAAYLYAEDAIARWGGAFLGDDMGLGKTQVLLALIAVRIRNGGYAILVGPPVALGTYENEIASAFPNLRLAHLRGRTVTEVPDADVYFLSDDAGTLQAWLTVDSGEVDGKGKPIMVASDLLADAEIYVRDEIHRDKGNQGKPSARAKVALIAGHTMRERGKPVVAATGTLLTNRPVEGYIPLQVVGGDELVKAVSPGAKGKSHFLFRYCSPQHNGFGYNYNGVNLERAAELHELLRRTVYVRREKSDLGDRIPHGGWVITPLALMPSRMSRYIRIEKDLFNLLQEENGPDAVWRAKQTAEAIVRMQKLWEEAGVAKAEASAEYILDLIEADKKVVVFFHHQRVRDALIKRLAKVKAAKIVIIDGSTKGQDRKDAEHAIQTGDANICLANIKAAGMAITLTSASEAVFVQVPWSAGDLKQAADRIRRADQISMDRAARGEDVTFHVLQASYDNGDPTFDNAMWSILEVKAKVCDAVNAGRDITMPDESVTQQALTAWFDQQAANKRHRGW